MTEEQRRKLIDLHRASVSAQHSFDLGDITGRSRDEVEQAFLDYVYSLGLDGAK